MIFAKLDILLDDGKTTKSVWVRFEDEIALENSSVDLYDNVIHKLDFSVEDPESQIECVLTTNSAPLDVNVIVID